MSLAALELLSLLSASDVEFAAAVQRHGGRRLVNDLFDYAARVQMQDADEAMRAVAVVDRVMAVCRIL